MSPAEQARAVYDQEACARSFVQDVELHLLFGFLFSTPDYFVMGRGVSSDASDSLVVNPAFIFPRESQNAWQIYLCAGSGLAGFLQFMPYYLPLLCWERNNVLRWYETDRVLKRLGVKAKPSFSSA
jgi:hypothetical protein